MKDTVRHRPIPSHFSRLRSLALSRLENSAGRLACLALLVALAAAQSAGAVQISKMLAPGVSLAQEITSGDAQSALIANIVTVDPAAPSVRLKAAIGRDVVYVDEPAKGRETISSLAGRKRALVAVNCDFFPFTGDPLGVCVVDGELVSEPDHNRVAVAVTKSPGIFFDNPILSAALTLRSGIVRQIDGINRDRATNQVVVYTPTFGSSTRTKHKGTEVTLASTDLPVRIGKPLALTVIEVRTDAVDTPIPPGGMVISAGGPAAWFLKENLKAGDALTVRFDIKSACGADWTQVEQAASGGPWLLKDGKEFIDYVAQGFSASFSTTRHPRTALSLTSDGKLLIVTVDGRQTISRGISLPDLAALMKRLGAVSAINLDGGGSTTLSIRGAVANTPSEGIERPVANALLVFAQPSPTDPLPGLTIVAPTGDLPSGQGVQLRLVSGDDVRPLSREQLDKVTWGVSGGIGFVNQEGYFIPIKPNRGSVVAFYGSQRVSADVTVVPGPPAVLRAVLTPDKHDPLRASLSITVFDSNYNRLGSQQVAVEVTGGTPDAAAITTNDKGEASVGITWDPASAERSVRTSIGDLCTVVTPEAAK